MPFWSLFSLTQSTTPIIGPIAKLFGLIIEYIYNFFYTVFNLESLGWTIIVFTIIARLLMLPLAFKQQKMMKKVQNLQPELKKIQDKYKGKKDKESQQKQQMEMSELYKKHGTTPFGGCLPVLVQFPIIMALFAVLKNVPAYIGQIKQIYLNIVDKVVGVSGYGDILIEMNENVPQKIANFNPDNKDNVVDLLNKFGTEKWSEFFTNFPDLGEGVNQMVDHIHHINHLFGINLADKPDLLSIGVLIPVLNVLVQFMVSKMTMSASSNGSANQTNKTMMYTMPLVTAFFVTKMPAGLGLYWLVGALFQLVQQILINKHLQKVEVKK